MPRSLRSQIIIYVFVVLISFASLRFTDAKRTPQSDTQEIMDYLATVKALGSKGFELVCGQHFRERYSCDHLPPHAPSGAYEFPVLPEFREPGFDRVLFYCEQGQTSILNHYDPVPQYDRWTLTLVKDGVQMPPHIPKLRYWFEGDANCLNTNSAEGCANHVKPLGVMRFPDGSRRFVLRWERCGSCAVSFHIEYPNYIKATSLKMIGFAFSSLGHPAVLTVNGSPAFGTRACKDTNVFMNEQGAGCCGYNSCFVNTHRQFHDPRLEQTLPDKPEHLTGYPFPEVYFQVNSPVTPKEAELSVNGRAPENMRITTAGKSGGRTGGDPGEGSSAGGIVAGASLGNPTTGWTSTARSRWIGGICGAISHMLRD